MSASVPPWLRYSTSIHTAIRWRPTQASPPMTPGVLRISGSMPVRGATSTRVPSASGGLPGSRTITPFWTVTSRLMVKLVVRVSAAPRLIPATPLSISRRPAPEQLADFLLGLVQVRPVDLQEGPAAERAEVVHGRNPHRLRGLHLGVLLLLLLPGHFEDEVQQVRH